MEALNPEEGGGKTAIHYNAEPQTAELLRRTIIAVNHLSIYGAVAEECRAFTQRTEGYPSQSARKFVAKVSNNEAPKVSV